MVDIPPPEGAGVRVQVRSAGICGPDLHRVSAGFAIADTLGHAVAADRKGGAIKVVLEP